MFMITISQKINFVLKVDLVFLYYTLLARIVRDHLILKNKFILSPDTVFIENQFLFADKVQNLECGENIVILVTDVILGKFLFVHLKTQAQGIQGEPTT